MVVCLSSTVPYNGTMAAYRCRWCWLPILASFCFVCGWQTARHDQDQNPALGLGYTIVLCDPTRTKADPLSSHGDCSSHLLPTRIRFKKKKHQNAFWGAQRRRAVNQETRSNGTRVERDYSFLCTRRTVRRARARAFIVGMVTIPRSHFHRLLISSRSFSLPPYHQYQFAS